MGPNYGFGVFPEFWLFDGFNRYQKAYFDIFNNFGIKPVFSNILD